MSAKSALLRVAKGILRCAYAPMKLLPTRDRIYLKMITFIIDMKTKIIIERIQ